MRINCSDCKKVVCPLCYIEGHQGHQWSDAKKAAEEFCNQFQSNIRNLASRRSDLRCEIIELDKVKESMVRKAQSLEFAMKERRTDLKELVDKEADLLVLELASLKNRKMKEIEIEKDYIRSQTALLESNEMYSNEFITKGTDSDLCRSVVGFKARAVELQQISHSTIQRQLPSFRMSFKKTPVEEYVQDAGSCNIIGKLEGNNANSVITEMLLSY